MTNIEWTSKTWNPITGCSKISSGCLNCYAERMANRLMSMGTNGYNSTVINSNGKWSGKLELVESRLHIPLKTKKPTIFFLGSMTDIFHKAIQPSWLYEIWDIMEKCPQHTFQILTKRAKIMAGSIEVFLPVLQNVWAGVTVESDNYKYRIDYLRSTPAVKKFVSFEPLLTNIENPNLSNIDWAIVGAESGKNRRHMDESWVSSLRDECINQNVKFFYKQRFENGKKISLPQLDGIVWREMP